MQLFEALVVVQVTRLVMLDITHMCRRPVSLLDTDIVSRLVAPMCRCPVSPLPPSQGAEGCADGLPAPAPAHPLPGPGGVRGEEAGSLRSPRGGHPRQPHQAGCRDPLQVPGLVTGHHVTMLCCRRGTRQLEDGVIFSRDVRMTVPSLEQLSLEDHLEIARKVGC